MELNERLLDAVERVYDGPVVELTDLVDEVAQLEAKNKRLKEAWAKFKRWAENKRKYEESGGDPEYEAYLAKERAEAEAMLEALGGES